MSLVPYGLFLKGTSNPISTQAAEILRSQIGVVEWRLNVDDLLEVARLLPLVVNLLP